MAIIDDRTAGRNYALPNAANHLKDDAPRLRLALAAVDTDVTDILVALAGKAALSHVHTIANVTGLQTALDGKIAVGYHDSLNDLADVSVTGAANGQVLIKQGASWIPIALQVGNVTGLEALLDGKATPANITTAINNLVAAAPGALDTLDELAAALGDDPNFATTVTNSIALKAPLASPALTGTPTAPTASPGTSTTQIATTAFVAAIAAPVADQIHAATTKATPVDADELGLADSAASFGLKKLTWANLKAAIWTFLSGTYITPWVLDPQTFTNFGTIASQSLYSRRVGDSKEFRGVVTIGTGVAAEARMTLGAGLAVSTAKAPSPLRPCGVMMRDAVTASNYVMQMKGGDAYLTFGRLDASNNPFAPMTGNNVNTGETLYIRALVPIW